MNKLDKDYQNLLQYILDNGVKKEESKQYCSSLSTESTTCKITE